MEEVIIPDVAINSAKRNEGGKLYSLYQSRPTKPLAEAIKNDLIKNSFDAVVRRTYKNKQVCFEVWWRKT